MRSQRPGDGLADAASQQRQVSPSEPSALQQHLAWQQQPPTTATMQRNQEAILPGKATGLEQQTSWEPPAATLGSVGGQDSGGSLGNLQSPAGSASVASQLQEVKAVVQRPALPPPRGTVRLLVSRRWPRI